MPTIKVDTTELRAVGVALRGADKEIRRELFKAVQRATKPVKAEIKAEAERSLPSGGGLGKWVARIGIRTRTALSGRSVGITIEGTLNNKAKVRGRGKGRRARHTFGQNADLGAINRGRVMHPAWGRGPLVGPQMVKAGFWDRPLQTLTAERARREILAALEAVKAQIAAAAKRAA